MMRGIPWIAAVALGVGAIAAADPERTLRVCADPNNYPFSRADGRGFENEIANVIAKELGATVAYTWHAQRRGFFRETLKAKACDVVIGVPVGLGMARTTKPYYRSSYVFVTRPKLTIASLDDPRLRSLEIGVPMVGDDGANPPPEHALARRGIVDNVRGYSVYGDYRDDAPPADLIRAVADGEIDVAIVWGPLAGAFAKAQHLRVTPIAQADDDGVPLAFDIAVGVRKKDEALAAELDRALAAHRREIDAILDRYGVPRGARPDQGARK
jgi:mxaJ protein